MCDIEFYLPLNKESLLESSDSYYVKSVCVVSQLKDQLKQSRDAFHYDGPEAVLNNFDTYYSVIYHGEKLSIEMISKSLQDLTKPYQQLSVYLESILDESDIAQEIQLKTLNIIKMLTYLYSQITILLENKIDTKNRNDLNMVKKTGRGRGKSKKPEDDDFDSQNKCKQLTLLLKILQLPIYKLWDPPVCEEQFINLIADMCFSFLVNPAIKYEKEMWKLIFYIFGNLIKNYSYSLTFTVRLTQAIKDQEHLETIVPGGIKILVEEYNCISLVRELVRELTEWQSDEAYQDVPGSKHCSVILTEMTALMPNLMLPEVVYLLKYLNNNSYTLRNCILSIITEVVLTVLTNENIPEEQIEIRNKLLNKLKSHICDVNAHVRSKVLQQWTRLHMEEAIPKDMQADVLKRACTRLQDKATLVRKAAIQLMTTFLKCNPYSATLDFDFYKKELTNEINKCNSLTSDNIANDILEKIKNKEVEWNSMKDNIRVAIKKCLESEDIEAMETDSNKSKDLVKELIMSEKYEEAFYICKQFIVSNENSKREIEQMDSEKLVNFYETFMQSVYTDLNKDTEELVQINIDRLTHLTPEQVEEIKKCEENVKYFNDVVTFLEIIDNNVFPLMKNLLKSATMTDVNEAIEFFVTAYQFKIKRSDEGLAAMLTQMNTTEQDRKKAVIDAYKNVFLTYEGAPKDKPEIISERLVKLLKNINAAEFNYLADVIMQWADKGDIEQGTVQYLWHMFIGQITNTVNDDRIAALQILSMIATGRKTIIERNMNLVAELIFSDKCLEDPRFITVGCNMLGLMEENVDINSKNPCFRVSYTDPMWEHLLDKVYKIFTRKDPFAHAVVTASVELIYRICQKPDILSTKLIKSIISLIHDSNGNILTDGKINTTHLALLCHLIGEVAIRQFSYLDNVVFKELKRRCNMKEESKKTQRKSKNKQSLNISKASASSRTPNIGNKEEDPEESYLEGAQADDIDAEYILNVCEREIVSSNLLGNFAPMLVHIVRHPHKFVNEELQASAVQALIRFMIVSSQFCSDHLLLVMTALEKSKFASVKNNIFVALADLLHRFPNIIEPWSTHIFRVVKDEDDTVRMTAVSILSKLIMEDMLRVKGTIADLALCIVDKSPIIVQMTEEFFQLLAQKGNTIYNVLPDIISRLSNDTEQIDQDTFKKVMTFLIQLISKDKHIESLVEKLCLRFKLSDLPRVWRDIAYCLTLLMYNEKSLIRLEENFPAYKQCLEDDIVYDLMLSIVNKYRNSSKDEIKNVTKKLDQLIRTGEITTEDSTMNETTKAPKPKPVKKPKSKRVRVQFDEDSD